MLSQTEILHEYMKCLQDPGYGIETYLKTFDRTQEGFVPFKLFPKQREIINAYRDHRFNLVAKPRQAGVSTTTAAYAALLVATADKNNPENILILANKQDMAQEFLGKIKDFITQLPRWFWGEDYYGSDKKEDKSIFNSDSKKEITLPNKCRVRAVATSKDALRGFTPTFLIMDEAAFIDDGATVFGAALTALGTGGGATLISTPNGMDALYYETYENSKLKKNNFNVIEMRWYEDPRYNKDLRWVRGDELIHHKDFPVDPDYCEKMIKDKWKPTSTWYEHMCSGMNHNARMIAQELDVSFLGSGGNVIHDEYIKFQEDNNVIEPPIVAGADNEIWVWEQPIEGHEYILGADVSRGDGEDYSTMVIIDTTTMEQVMEYQGKIQPDLFGNLINEYGLHYDAYVVVDATGGMGVSTVLKLLELGYPKLHYDTPRNKVLTSKSQLDDYLRDNKVPGFNVGSARIPMISHLEYMIRTNSVKVRSARITSEMKHFIYKNGRPDHTTGKHDDLIMALAMPLWIYQSSFKDLEKSKARTKAMLDSWKVNTPNQDPKQQQRDQARPKFAPIVSKNMQDPRGDFLWLFK